MNSSTEPVRSSAERLAERTAELDVLIDAFRTAQTTGDRAAATRFIDRAWRIAPKNPEINRLYGLMLLSDGSLDEGVARLDTAQDDDPSSDFEALCISTLCAAGRIDSAHDRLVAALSRFAVTQDSELAMAARKVVTAMAPRYAGWVGIGPDLAVHGEMVGAGKIGGAIRIVTGGATIAEQDYTAADGCFTVPLPCRSAPMIVAADHGRLLGATLRWPSDFGFDGGIPAFRDGKMLPFDGPITGWARVSWDPHRPVVLTVSNEAGFSAEIPAEPDPLAPSRHHFTLTPALLRAIGNIVSIDASMPDGTSRPLPGSPLIITPPPAPRPLPRKRPLENTAAKEREIDIVIPVYSGLTETLDCIRSVRKTVGAHANIVVVDDATPEPALAAALDNLAAAKAVTLLRNACNLGFPETVNRGMQLNPDRDVVILNADTEVFGDWLARLRAAAYRTGDTGSATPLTNFGSIASYPASGTAEPDTASAAALDRLARTVNADVTVDIPTGVGFCLFIRRDCLDAVGYFDSATFGKGYGEENDFSLRAAMAGWRHVLAANVYVRHAGARSFGARKTALYERNLRLLFLRYPSYHAATDAFGDADPAHEARRRLDEARLREIKGKSVLIVSLSLDGGTRRAVESRAERVREAGMTAILLQPVPGHADRWKLSIEGALFEDLFYDGVEEIDRFVSLIRSLALDRVEFHHFLDLSPALAERFFDLGCPVDIYIHDYIWYCPRITLLDGNSRYCGEPNSEICDSCVARNGSRLTETIPVASLRKRSHGWLAKARARYVPTPSVARRMAAQFPELSFEELPLETPVTTTARPRPTGGRPIKVALIGAIGDHKGYGRLLEMSRDAAARQLPLEFVVIGHTKDDSRLMETGNVFVTGEFQETEVAALLAREAPDLALFLSEFPETWCYALTHALRAGIPVAGLDIGAIGDRLRNQSDAPLLFPTADSAATLCDRIVAAFQDSSKRGDTGRDNLPNATSEFALEHDIIASPRGGLAERERLRKNMVTQLSTMPASVDFLPLTRGLFLFSVKSTQPPALLDPQSQITLPAMQIAPAPGSLADVEFVSAPSTANAWLSQPYDRIVVRVTAPSAILVLSSIAGPNLEPVEVEIQRLDAGAPDTLAEPSASARALPPLATDQKSIALKIITHVQNRGDIESAQSQWAGGAAEGLWIESFSVSPTETLSADQIEYKALTSTGVETPWIGGGGNCGTRGIGVPLVGFAVQLKSGAGAEGTCEYGALLASGAVVGPARNGVMCRSTDPQDMIVGIWIAIDGRRTAGVEPVTARQQDAAKSPAPAPTAPPSQAKGRKGTTGPRFSVFRTPGETE